MQQAYAAQLQAQMQMQVTACPTGTLTLSSSQPQLPVHAATVVHRELCVCCSAASTLDL